MCTVLLPPGVNAIAVNKYTNIKRLCETWFVTSALGWFIGSKGIVDW